MPDDAIFECYLPYAEPGQTIKVTDLSGNVTDHVVNDRGGIQIPAALVNQPPKFDRTSISFDYGP